METETPASNSESTPSPLDVSRVRTLAKKVRVTKFAGWIGAAFLLVFVVWFWTSAQGILDPGGVLLLVLIPLGMAGALLVSTWYLFSVEVASISPGVSEGGIEVAENSYLRIRATASIPWSMVRDLEVGSALSAAGRDRQPGGGDGFLLRIKTVEGETVERTLFLGDLADRKGVEALADALRRGWISQKGKEERGSARFP